MKPRGGDFVSAKDVADYAFCPESYRLKLAGARPSTVAKRRMAAGTRAHAAWTRKGRRMEAGWRPVLLVLFAALLIAGIIALLQVL